MARTGAAPMLTLQTREDRLDDLDQDLGQYRRELHRIDEAPPHRITDERVFLARRRRVVERIQELERERAGLVGGAS